MSRTIKQIAAATLGNASADYYTAPNATNAQILACTLSNKTGTAQTVTVTHTPSGGAAINLLNGITVPANAQIVGYAAIGQVINSGGKLSALCSAGASVDLTVSAVEVTL